MPYFYPDLRRADLRGWVSLCFVFPPSNLTSLRIFPPLFAVSLLAQCSPVCVHRADSADLPRGSHPPADDVLVEQMQARGTETGKLPRAGLRAETTTGAPDEPPKNPSNPALPSATLPTAPEQLGSRLGPIPQGTLQDGVFLLPGRNSPLSLCPRLCTSPGVSAGELPECHQDQAAEDTGTFPGWDDSQEGHPAGTQGLRPPAWWEGCSGHSEVSGRDDVYLL